MLNKAPGTGPGKTHRAVKNDVREYLKTTAKDHIYKAQPQIVLDAAPDPSIPSIESVVRQLGGGGIPADPAPAPPSTKHPVMSVRDLIEGDYLEPGDVILMTRLGSFFAWLLRFFDNSDFAHTAMVFQTPRQMEGIDQTFLIETSMAGVEIVSLSQFLVPKHVYADTGLPPEFVVGVKRLEKDWAGIQHRRMAASRMLHFIENEEYNFRLLAALASPRTRSLYFKLRDSFRGRAPAIGEFLKKGGSYLPGQFICSGFVQYAFIDMVRTGLQRGLIRPEEAERALEDVIFCPDATMQSEIEELMACTPKFLAYTQKLQWKYLVHKGEVFHVTSSEEVHKFFKETLPKRVSEQPAA